MAGENDELVVEIPSDVIQFGQDADGLPRTDPVAPAKPARAAPDADGAVKTGDRDRRERERLQRERDELAERAARAEQIAAQALADREQASQLVAERTGQTLRAHAAKVYSDYQQIVGAIGAAQTEAQTAEQEFVRASEAGEHARAAAAQRSIAKAEAALAQLESGKVAAESAVREAHDLLNRGATTPSAPAQPAAPPPRAPTPDEWIDTARQAIGDDGADWLRENKQYVTDPRLNKRLLRFVEDYADEHGQSALKEDGFRAALDAKFFPDKGGDGDGLVVEQTRPASSRAAPAAPTPRAKPAAPVSRAGNVFSSRNMGATQVRLPPALARFAREAGLDATKYALGIVAEIKAGKLPKEYLDPDYDHGV